MDSYADRLKYAMSLKGINQSELARMIGVKPQAIQYLCREGKKSVHTVSIAKALDVSAEWLATGKGPKTAAEGGQANIESNAPTITESIADWTSLSQDAQKLITLIAEASSSQQLDKNTIAALTQIIRSVTPTTKTVAQPNDYGRLIDAAKKNTDSG